jgi:NADH-quinone oxidoreductase subunit N
LFWLVGIGVLNSVISVYYYLRVVLVMYVGEGPAEPMQVDRHAAIALAVALVGVLVLGIVPESAMVAATHAAAILFRG